MCLDPIKIPYNGNYVNTHTIGSLYQILPCGQCAECRKKQAQEYMTRALSEHEYTEEQGGFSYFETFTHDDDTVPTFGDILCFDTDSRTKFMKRLRRNLEYAGYDVKDNLSYFWVSEFGGITHRPHYHCIFNVRIPNMTTYKFYVFLKKSWKFGRLDDDKCPIQKKIDGLGALHYVSKYVSKDDDFVRLLRHKILEKVYGKDYPEYVRAANSHYSLKRLVEKYSHKIGIDLPKYRTIAPFHRQSKGFGIHILDQYNIDEMLKNGYMLVKDEKYGKKKVAIPTYIKRKLFYSKVNIFGKDYQRLNATGIKFRLQHLDDVFDMNLEKYRRIYNNLSVYAGDKTDEVKKRIDDLIGDSSLENFVSWKMSYQGKWIAESFLNRVDITDSNDMYLRYLTRHLLPLDDNNENINPNIEALHYSRDWSYNDVMDSLSDDETEQCLRDWFGEVDYNERDVDRIFLLDDYFPEWTNLDALFSDLILSRGRIKQAEYDRKQAIASRLKALNSNYRVKSGKKVNKILEKIETFAS